MVFDQSQPYHLCFGKVNSTGVFAHRPLHEIEIDLISKRGEGVGITISNRMRDTRSVTFASVECFTVLGFLIA